MIIYKCNAVSLYVCLHYFLYVRASVKFVFSIRLSYFLSTRASCPRLIGLIGHIYTQIIHTHARTHTDLPDPLMSRRWFIKLNGFTLTSIRIILIYSLLFNTHLQVNIYNSWKHRCTYICIYVYKNEGRHADKHTQPPCVYAHICLAVFNSDI